jgi:hypothetical protein
VTLSKSQKDVLECAVVAAIEFEGQSPKDSRVSAGSVMQILLDNSQLKYFPECAGWGWIRTGDELANLMDELPGIMPLEDPEEGEALPWFRRYEKR